jgi:hypothetical protein
VTVAARCTLTTEGVADADAIRGTSVSEGLLAIALSHADRSRFFLKFLNRAL